MGQESTLLTRKMDHSLLYDYKTLFRALLFIINYPNSCKIFVFCPLKQPFNIIGSSFSPIFKKFLFTLSIIIRGVNNKTTIFIFIFTNFFYISSLSKRTLILTNLLRIREKTIFLYDINNLFLTGE